MKSELKKQRLDILLFDKGLAESREKAKTLIMMGRVYVDGQKSDKPGVSYNPHVNIEVRGEKLPYVSRGGLKIEKAIKEFKIDLKDKLVLDVGASTGGFTDCMLQNGAKMIYAVDVGYGQLDWKLRKDPRVCNMERINIRYLELDKENKRLVYNKTTERIFDLQGDINFFSADVSFISLKLVLPVIKELVSYEAEGVCLIKPQFEAGREKVGKKGVVRDRSVHIDVLKEICSFAMNIGFRVDNLTYSPIKGPEGNIEYLVYLKNNSHSIGLQESYIDKLVDTAFLELK